LPSPAAAATSDSPSGRNCFSNGRQNVEPFVLEGAGHLLHLENPRGMAEGLAPFFDRHPIAT
jgi:hypothetical protein